VEIDLAAAARFLAALSPDTLHTFQTFDDAKRHRRGLTDIVHGTFDAKARRLAALNHKGAGVFVMVNRGDGMGRSAANVTGCRALFLDLDGSPIEPVLAAPIAPRIVVESSPGKWHAYWPIADLPTDQFTASQKTLAAMFAGDSKVNDRPRVMRLPGFLHRKGEPFLSRLVTCESAPLTWQEMADAFGLAQRLTLPNIVPVGERNNTLFKLAKSAAAKGVPEAEQYKRALQVNAKRFEHPLPEAEVAGIVASAYSDPQAGVARIPHAVMDSPAYKRLSDGARTLLLLAYRKLDGFNNGRISLAWSECIEWFPQKNRFQRIRREAIDSGLIEVAQQAIKPKAGIPPSAALYALAIGAKTAPYPVKPIGAKTVPLEAFQAVAVESFEDALDGGDPKRRAVQA
jgi:hypothetical protein